MSHDFIYNVNVLDNTHRVLYDRYYDSMESVKKDAGNISLSVQYGLIPKPAEAIMISISKMSFNGSGKLTIKSDDDFRQATTVNTSQRNVADIISNFRNF